MSEDHTIDYYNKNADQYFADTVSVDMSKNCDQFLAYVRPGGCIIDIGAGSGRDMKYFKDRGYKVEGIDASSKMCRVASEYSGANVTCVKIQDWIPEKAYSGIWANASLIHLKLEEIACFFKKLPSSLEQNGIAYVSFKSGISTGEDADDRYFANVTENWIQQLIENTPNLELIDSWASKDQMLRNDFYWINFLIKKAK